MSDDLSPKPEPGTPQPIEAVVQAVEDLLLQARSGQLLAIGWATYRGDGAVQRGWARAPKGAAHALGAAIADLAFAYAADREVAYAEGAGE